MRTVNVSWTKQLKILDLPLFCNTMYYVRIIPRAPWNSCEEIFRIKNTRFILLKTLKFSYGLCHKNGKNYKTHALPDF